MGETKRILSSIEQGDPKAAEELLPLVYDELRRLARGKMAKERPGQTLQATALVHEAYLRLIGSDTRWAGRNHFFSAAAEAMRRILVDIARRKRQVRHGGGQQKMDIDEIQVGWEPSEDKLVQIHEVLDDLEREDTVKASVVKLRFFVGLNNDEVADALSISKRSVERYWSYSKAWILQAIRDRERAGSTSPSHSAIGDSASNVSGSHSDA